MIPIQNFLHKIKWDKKEKPEEYVLFYYDRVEDTLKEIKYTDILRIEDNFLILTINGKEANVPLHRIKKILKKGEVVWDR